MICGDLLFCGFVVEVFEAIGDVFGFCNEVFEVGVFEEVGHFWAICESKEGSAVIDRADDGMQAHGDDDFGFGKVFVVCSGELGDFFLEWEVFVGLKGDEMGVLEFFDCLFDVVGKIGMIGHFAIAAKSENR